MNRNSQSSNSNSRGNKALDPMKYEIANEFGVELGADASARANGSVGGEITKRLVSYAKNQMSGNSAQ